jgi:hypothetical protein
MCDTHEEEVKALMVKLLRVINANDGEVKPDVAMPALLYVTGFLLGKAGHGVPLSDIYLQIVNDIEHARRTSVSVDETHDLMERLKEGA